MDATRRFSNRVQDYVKYRPSYPAAVLDWLGAKGILLPGAVVADVGSGTGILTRLFLERGHAVFGVEPNAEMRAAGEEQLRGIPGFTSVDGTAEATTLADGSVGVVAAGQAFHWFDRVKSRAEFQRILRVGESGGWVVLIWNERLVETSAFLGAYERLLHSYATDYQFVDHRRMTDEVIGEFFSPGGFELKSFANRQGFDLAGLTGRVLSSSYTPSPEDPRHPEMLAAVGRMFEAHQVGGEVALEYETKVYVGRV